jgi:hypothetical protein
MTIAKAARSAKREGLPALTFKRACFNLPSFPCDEFLALFSSIIGRSHILLGCVVAASINFQ